jgi:hypothetical protein
MWTEYHRRKALAQRFGDPDASLMGRRASPYHRKRNKTQAGKGLRRQEEAIVARTIHGLSERERQMRWQSQL